MAPTNQPLNLHESRMLKECGWVATQHKANDADAFERAVLSLGQFLGTPTTTRNRRLVDRLTPTHADKARPNSLSRMSGTGQQPWHMDMAYRVEPARYLVMGMHECPARTADTELLNASTLVPADLSEEALSEPFLIRTGARSFYATIKAKGAPFVRFDPGCMQGSTARARALMQQLLNRTLAPTHFHQWTPGAVLVIDNWKMFHRRADATGSTNRTLYRVSVMGGTT
ncbi:MAG: TauD/TfdA family dioxygenase [Burkholderiales bacterium]|nr:TauD/TfdA family dioxygenase [Burkholderiales bacterium]